MNRLEKIKAAVEVSKKTESTTVLLSVEDIEFLIRTAELFENAKFCKCS